MSPIDTLNIMDRARGASRVGDHAEAERLLKQYLEKNKNDREALLLLGATYAKSGNTDAALDVFLSLLASNPDDLEALNNIAVIYRKKEDLNKALDALEHAIDIDPTRPELHYNLGNVYKQLGNYKAASMAYAKVIELDPRYVPAYNNLGTMYDRLQESEKAFAVFQKGLSLDRNNPVLHFNYGLALDSKGKFEDAVREYEAALRSRPGWVEALNNLGIIRLKQGRHTDALEVFNRILNIDPFNAEARNNIGVVLADQGKYNEAIKYYRQAIEAEPKYVKAVVNLEHALEAIGHPGDALIELEKLVKLVPDSSEVRIKLAALYLKLQRYPEALEQATRALEWDQDNIQALRIQGAAYRAIGKNAEAQACFEKILSIDPGNFAFYLDLADLHFQRKEYQEAEERILAFLRRKPQDRNAKMMLGRLYAETGNKAHAITIFEELIRDNPQDVEALAALAELHKKSGDIEKAVKTADTLINLQGKRATSEDLTNLNKSLELYEEAVRSYSASLQDIWERNLQALRQNEEVKAAETQEETNPLLLSAIDSIPVEEESDNLFIEDVEESFDENEDEEEELVLDDEAYSIFDEMAEPQDSLDNLVAPEDGRVTPDYNEPENPVPEETPQGSRADEGEGQNKMDNLPPERPETPPPYPLMPQMPQMPPIQFVSIPQQPAPQVIPPYMPPPYQPVMPQAPQEPLPPPRSEPQRQAAPENKRKPEPEPAKMPEPLPEMEPAFEPEPESAPLSEPELERGVEPEPELPEEEVLPELPTAEPMDSGISEDEMAELLEYPAEAELPELNEDDGLLEYPEELPEEELWDDSIMLEDEESEQESPVENEVVPEPEMAPAPVLQSQDTKGLSETAMLNLFQYLKNLTEELPEDQKRAFKASEVRLKMEYVIDKLEGHQGLFKTLMGKTGLAQEQKVPARQESKPDPKSVAQTLAYLSNLAKTLPDRDLTRVIEKKVDTVVKGLVPDGGRRE
ncbi:MAG: tetratricopeptide repeat protein [Treponema sp.]|nr:tetratricopeptide repeat protein [Treponema sp.]